ncbi:YdiU family protein [Flavobacterium sediminis]|uniref:Protein nucleotidyltransferase YdiU n=1 Tax=Flavobacterium sediminis TaxID=2201181 RepID=A0A2U8QRV4_9FLAO|nr:YdiU family protein [Flavobacterium sediminis]AWM12575.1 YdiU family protein [Flavobacterium sediminis]
MQLPVTTIFTEKLPADPETSNEIRQVYEAMFSYVTPKVPLHPKLVHASAEVAQLIGLSEQSISSDDFIAVFSGKKVLEGTKPFAMCYGGHQFGNWAGQLGDGRAINLFEVQNQGQNLMVQLKGAGKTPYSRRGDGLAVLRSSIREHLCSEAMYHLGVPTTRSLSVMETGEKVLRDILYNGNAAYEKGAVVCRVAPSFIRFGNFEIFAARQDVKNLKLLADFCIETYFPSITTTGKERYIAFFQEIATQTKELLIHWQRVGFVHGVMNTDNMSIHGITIDYGPYGWLEGYDPHWTPNTTDAQGKRYRFGNQPHIALWNLLQLANALYPLIEETQALERILEQFNTDFQSDFNAMMLNKLGITKRHKENENLIHQLLITLQETETDMTIFYRLLARISKNDSESEALQKIKPAFYQEAEIKDSVQETWYFWLSLYLNSLKQETVADAERKRSMDLVNPKYVLRNYMAQLAIEAAEKEDYSLVDELAELLKRPYDEQPEYEKWFAKRPDWARTKIGCSMLSCSS